MITKLRRQMIFMVMGVVTVLLMAIFLILYHYFRFFSLLNKTILISNSYIFINYVAILL